MNESNKLLSDADNKKLGWPLGGNTAANILDRVKERNPAFRAIDTLCYLPFIHVEASATGECKQCCMAENPIIRDYSELPVDQQKELIHLKDELVLDNLIPLVGTDNIGIDGYPGTGNYCRPGTNDVGLWNLKDSTISDAFNSKYMDKLRDDFVHGIKPPSCNKCWDEEDAGIKSKRILFAEVFSRNPGISVTTFIDPITDVSIKYLDLKLGNICNLKCRICGSSSSSKWAQEEMDMAMQFESVSKQDVKKTVAYKRLKLGNWPRENGQFWENLEEILPNVVHLEFTGGEPWLIQEHFDLLQTAIDKGYANKIYIHYNTNGTQLPIHALENIWPHFKWVAMSFSIDDVEQKFEYQRYGADWDEVNYNISYICKNKSSNMNTEITTTVNLLNIKSIPDIFNWIKTINIDNNGDRGNGMDLWYLNLMHKPDHFNISILPDAVKLDITDYLTNFNWDSADLLTGWKAKDDFADDVLSIVDYMNTHEVEDLELARCQCNDLIYKIDYLRKQKIIEVDPWLMSAIGYDPIEMKQKWPNVGDNVAPSWPRGSKRIKYIAPTLIEEDLRKRSRLDHLNE